MRAAARHGPAGFIVLTINLLVARYGVAVSNFLVALGEPNEDDCNPIDGRLGQDRLMRDARSKRRRKGSALAVRTALPTRQLWMRRPAVYGRPTASGTAAGDPHSVSPAMRELRDFRPQKSMLPFCC
jgi:hypothetical protein